MDTPVNERVKNHIDHLKSECGELETCLQNGTTTEDVCIASKRIVLAAAELDEMIVRCLASASKLERKLAGHSVGEGKVS
jgi:hypothetical protein